MSIITIDAPFIHNKVVETIDRIDKRSKMTREELTKEYDKIRRNITSIWLERPARFPLTFKFNNMLIEFESCISLLEVIDTTERLREAGLLKED